MSRGHWRSFSQKNGGTNLQLAPFYEFSHCPTGQVNELKFWWECALRICRISLCLSLIGLCRAVRNKLSFSYHVPLSTNTIHVEIFFGGVAKSIWEITPTNSLASRRSTNRVLWVVSGGSNSTKHMSKRGIELYGQSSIMENFVVTW